ncbi:MAG: Aspartate aminotransferase [uncultured Thermomicrobiales bacterium]|uniref:Aminotransferase n=1 Tax=uncultured Thermomicrobiales bacterium TaxID=1645740 RepID=A0A6J4UQA8_9BACT|nr:MAG: Aspartate aminotransferase [uncultured Thermomicrobiales bacterium]
MRLSESVLAVPPSGIRRFFDAVSRMEDVISLGVGEPDFATPWTAREAAIFGLERGRTSYTANHGLIELRRAIAAHVASRGGPEYDPHEQVLVTVGVSEGLDLGLRALINPGDEVIVPEPCYVSYAPCVRLAGGIPVPLETTAEDGFVPRPDRLERLVTPRTRAIVINYPNNPTGATMNRPLLLALAEIAARHDLVVLSDEVYDRLTYAGVHQIFAALPGMAERTLLLNGFSKAYAMTGWRVGYAAGPEPWVAAMTKIHQYTALCASRPAQDAALEALRRGERDVLAMVDDYDARRRLIVAGFNRLGLPCHLPDGAFYAFPSIAPTGLSADEFADRLLHEARVAVVPGDVFGLGGAGHVRASYATALPKLEEALDRVGRFLDGLPGKRSGVEGRTPALTPA